jgi:two-component system sensor histidine kinase/response regulator
MQSFWAKVVGRPPGFSLEARIFNATCVTSAVCVFLTIFLNFLLGIPQLVILMVAILATTVLCYYYSRFKMKLDNCVIAYMIAINILLIVNFKYNSGINGPTLLIFILAYFLTISIVPQKQYWFWITLNLLIVTMLLVIEYGYPGTITNTYADTKSRFIDHGFTYILMAIFIFMVTTSVRRSYHIEHKLAEQKTTELENANDTKNKLFSILAHDLRSPLTSIQNYLEILSEFNIDEDERLSINNALLNSTRNTQQMLSNLLLWSKSQMEGVTVNMVKVNPKETLHSTFQIHQTIAGEKGIHLVNKLKKTVFIIADADMLQLIVRNLINNAIKFTKPGGEIIVSEDIVGDDCRIIIKDNGTGIPFEKQGSIFSLKVNSTYGTKNEKGVGLGLVLCKEFTELQNGKITFESTPGVGTSFYISLRLFGGNSENKMHGEEGQVEKLSVKNV